MRKKRAKSDLPETLESAHAMIAELRQTEAEYLERMNDLVVSKTVAAVELINARKALSEAQEKETQALAAARNVEIREAHAVAKLTTASDVIVMLIQRMNHVG